MERNLLKMLRTQLWIGCSVPASGVLPYLTQLCSYAETAITVWLTLSAFPSFPVARHVTLSPTYLSSQHRRTEISSWHVAAWRVVISRYFSFCSTVLLSTTDCICVWWEQRAWTIRIDDRLSSLLKPRCDTTISSMIPRWQPHSNARLYEPVYRVAPRSKSVGYTAV